MTINVLSLQGISIFTVSGSLIGRRTGILQLSGQHRGGLRGQDATSPSWRFPSLTSTLSLTRESVAATLRAVDHKLIRREGNHKVSKFHSG